MVRVNCEMPFCTVNCPVGQVLSVTSTVSFESRNAPVPSFWAQVSVAVQTLFWVVIGAEVELDATGLLVAFGSGQL